MIDELEFIKKELKKKGYPLENYVQSLLVRNNWHVQPNAYFWDKDTNKGRELDIMATYEYMKSNSCSDFLLYLLIQCRSLPGNAWIFFSDPGQSAKYEHISKSGLAEILEHRDLFIFANEIFSKKETHFDRSQVLATNYCEIITDKEKSNKRIDNIWECAITLVKATSQEKDKGDIDCKRYIEEDLGSPDEFVKNPCELVFLFYPLIVFEGKMYEAKFFKDDIVLDEKDYVQLFVDYQSGNYKGEFCIDVVTKEKSKEYMEDIRNDLVIFGKRMVKRSKEYQDKAIDAVVKRFKRGFFA